ncbi:hypothetical protein BJX64DRAFT_295091 [Aspergillus heterothallicus]
MECSSTDRGGSTQEQEPIGELRLRLSALPQEYNSTGIDGPSLPQKPLEKQSFRLLDLPPECILDIADQIPSQHDLNSLVRTSVKLHTLLDLYSYRRAFRAHHGQFEKTINRAISKVDPSAVRHWVRAGIDLTAFNARDTRMGPLGLAMKQRCEPVMGWDGRFYRQATRAELNVHRDIIQILLEAGGQRGRDERRLGYAATCSG